MAYTAAVTAAPVRLKLIDLRVQSLLEVGPKGSIIEKCEVAINDKHYPVQDAPCSLVGPATYKQLQHDYPDAVVWLTINNRSYNTI